MIRALLKKVGLLSKKKKSKQKGLKPVIIPRSEHGISRKNISENALKVLYRLHKHGYSAYLVGGGVRDLLLGLHPKDFDVVTDAKPEEVRKVFRNCRLIGRRFRLAHVYFGHDIIEVATFRGKADMASEDHMHSEQGMILRDNVYGTLEQDVWRRDFTVNALYYNIADYSIVDYVGGFEDIKARRLQIIGDVEQRYREDPVRMLRAIRFASKLSLALPQSLSQPLHENKDLLLHVSPARLFEEIIKMFHSGAALTSYGMLKDLEFLNLLFPQTAESLQSQKYPTEKLLSCIFENTDKRIKEDKSVTPSFIIAAILWHPICEHADKLASEGMHPNTARIKAIDTAIAAQCKKMSMPKRITQGAREIWLLQSRLVKRSRVHVHILFAEPRFRAAFDFLELRAKAGEDVQEAATWWLAFQDADAAQRKVMTKSLAAKRKRRRGKKT